MEEFRVAIEDCSLFDMGYNRHKFTWSNNQTCSNHIEERLDRFFTSNEWATTFENYMVENLIRKSSYQCPFFLEMQSAIDTRKHKRVLCFPFGSHEVQISILYASLL